MAFTQTLTLEGAGRLRPSRIGVRKANAGDFDAAPGASLAAPEFAADDFGEGPRTLAGFEITLACERRIPGLEFRPVVRNVSSRPLRLDCLVLGFRWENAGTSLRFLKNGWQSWSFTGSRELDDAGEPEFPSGPWLRGLHHAFGAPPVDRAGWHESHTVALAGPGRGGPACLAGVLETGRAFGVVYLRRDGSDLLVEVEIVAEAVLEPGEETTLERVRVALGVDASRLLENFADSWGRHGGARTRAPFQSAWCSWYHFFHEVSEDDVRRNLDALAASRDELPVDVVQIDDGYQAQIGDWLETNAKFPSGLEVLARDIASAGFTPGLWTAPFCAVGPSRLFQTHRDWMLRDQSGEPFRGLIHPEWSDDALVYALDPTHPDVVRHFESTFAQLAAFGFTYLKLDFLYVVSMHAAAHDQRVSRAARLRTALESVRRGAGEKAFLLGCGCPLGPAVGVVDGMRIGPDVAPYWRVDAARAIPGIEAALPSLHGSLRSVVHRVFMHRRLWLNDPDCLMVRRTETQLEPAEIATLETVIAATGGMGVVSDDVPLLAESDRRAARRCLALAREVDEAGVRGVARLEDPLGEGPHVLRATVARDLISAVVNLSDEPATPGSDAPLAPHASRLDRHEGAARLAVFCDFDGTFAVQDVGATLARRHAGDRRPSLFARYESGELTAWQYNMILLDGLEIPEKDLQAFLETIELDPGAATLVDWCDARAVPFRILSDGFDYNLDRLQELSGVRFDYTANRLRYEGDLWRIGPTLENPDCFCGTGACKRGWIESYRKANPGSVCVHVGNGAVSDLCGAIAADVVFAKDSLAPALEARGVAFEPFETLHDVVATLEAMGWK